MGYRCGIGGSMRRVGFEPREPHVFCDGCGVIHRIASGSPVPPKWFLDGKPPRGWRGLRSADGEHRWDLCPRCWR